MTETQRIVLRSIYLFEISVRLGKLLKWELSWKRRLHSERRRRKSRSWRRWPSKPGKNELASELLQVNRAVFKTNRRAYFNCKVQLFHTAITAQLLLVHREYVKSSYASVKILLAAMPGKVCSIWEKERGKRSKFLNSFFFKTTGGELTVVTTSSFLLANRISMDDGP